MHWRSSLPHSFPGIHRPDSDKCLFHPHGHSHLHKPRPAVDGAAPGLLSGPFSQSTPLQLQLHLLQTRHEVRSIQGPQLHQERQSGTGNYSLGHLAFKALHLVVLRLLNVYFESLSCNSFLFYVQMSPEEEERKRIRRERNKQAAAKCRNRRRELTDTLQAVSVPLIYYPPSRCTHNVRTEQPSNSHINL